MQIRLVLDWNYSVLYDADKHIKEQKLSRKWGLFIEWGQGKVKDKKLETVSLIM